MEKRTQEGEEDRSTSHDNHHHLRDWESLGHNSNLVVPDHRHHRRIIDRSLLAATLLAQTQSGWVRNGPGPPSREELSQRQVGTASNDYRSGGVVPSNCASARISNAILPASQQHSSIEIQPSPETNSSLSHLLRGAPPLFSSVSSVPSHTFLLIHGIPAYYGLNDQVPARTHIMLQPPQQYNVSNLLLSHAQVLGIVVGIPQSILQQELITRLLLESPAAATQRIPSIPPQMGYQQQQPLFTNTVSSSSFPASTNNGTRTTTAVSSDTPTTITSTTTDQLPSRASIHQTTAPAPEPPIYTSRSAIVLYVEDDAQVLTDYQCFLRKQLELFEASPVDVRSSSQGRNTPIILGQVGLRCRHCADLPLVARTKGAVYYSHTIDGIYQIAQNMSKVHLCQRCYRIPADIQRKLVALKRDAPRAAGGKHYWARVLDSMGVYQDGNILQMRRKKTRSDAT
jgi:hypothetical protein